MKDQIVSRPAQLIKSMQSDFIMRDEYMSRIRAEIYVSGGASPQSIPTGSTYTKSTAFTTDGQEVRCTADAANDKITITRPGSYKVSLTALILSGTAGVNFTGAVFIGGVISSNLKNGDYISGTSQNGNIVIPGGFINVTTPPIDVDFRIVHDNGGAVNVTVIDANLSVLWIGIDV